MDKNERVKVILDNAAKLNARLTLSDYLIGSAIEVMRLLDENTDVSVQEAFKAMDDGKRIRHKTWPGGVYMSYVNGKARRSDGYTGWLVIEDNMWKGWEVLDR